MSECQCLECQLGRARTAQVEQATPKLADGSHQGNERSPIAYALKPCGLCGVPIPDQGSRVHTPTLMEQRPCPGSWSGAKRGGE